MNDVANDIIDYLVARGICTAAGTDIFNGLIPDNVNNAVMVLETGGPAPSIDLPLDDITFQVYLRNTDDATGRALLKSIHNALHQNQTGSGSTSFGALRFDNTYANYYYYIYAQSEGGHIGKDDVGRDEFSINFITKTR
jgi:hypothetical protein